MLRSSKPSSKTPFLNIMPVARVPTIRTVLVTDAAGEARIVAQEAHRRSASKKMSRKRWLTSIEASID